MAQDFSQGYPFQRSENIWLWHTNWRSLELCKQPPLGTDLINHRTETLTQNAELRVQGLTLITLDSHKRGEDLFPTIPTILEVSLQDHKEQDFHLSPIEASLVRSTATYYLFHQGITQFFRDNNKTETKDPTTLLSLTSKDSQRPMTWDDPNRKAVSTGLNFINVLCTRFEKTLPIVMENNKNHTIILVKGTIGYSMLDVIDKEIPKYQITNPTELAYTILSENEEYNDCFLLHSTIPSQDMNDCIRIEGGNSTTILSRPNSIFIFARLI